MLLYHVHVVCMIFILVALPNTQVQLHGYPIDLLWTVQIHLGYNFHLTNFDQVLKLFWGVSIALRHQQEPLST